MTNTRTLKFLVSAAFAVSWLAASVPFVAYHARLPEPLATHWGFSGAADGAMPQALWFALFTVGQGLCVTFAWRTAARAKFTHTEVASIASLTFISWVLSSAMLATVWLNLNVASWQQAGRFSPRLLLSALTLAAATTLLVRSTLARYANDDASTPNLTLEFAPSDRIYWSGTARNPWFGRCALVTFVASLLLVLLVPWPTALLALVPAPLLQLFARVRVTVDKRRVTIHYGSTGLLKQHFTMNRVQHARAIDVTPLSQGGWGYRGSLWLLGRAAVVVRKGRALALTFDGQKRLVITVDDADTAASVIEGLLLQRAEARR